MFIYSSLSVRPGRDADPSPLSSTEVKNREELYLYSPSGPSWPVTGWNLPSSLSETVSNSGYTAFSHLMTAKSELEGKWK